MNHDDLVTTVGPHPSPATNGVSWGAVFAGTLVAAGAWILLHLLGMAVGLTAIEPDDPGSLRAVGIGAGTWSLIAPVIALFLGGLATGKLAATPGRATRAIHGVVVWSLSTVVSITLLWMMLGAVIGAAVEAGTTVASATATGAMGAIETASQATPELLGLSPEELLVPVNDRLRAEGKPPVAPEQLMTALREALRTSIREGRLDRQLIVDSLARHTALSPGEINEIADSVQRRYDERFGQVGEAVRQQAYSAAESAGKALFGLSLAMLLALAAAVAGVMLGGRRMYRRVPRAGGSTNPNAMR